MTKYEYDYASGSFGKWIKDEFGLPAYHYTCNQIKDPKAVSPVNKKITNPTEHLFLVGNDRLVSVASNYGHVRMRQDEGSPKFLNDYYPEIQQYAGGVGYLYDGKIILNTYYNDQKKDLERIYGIGYFRKTLKHVNYDIDQCIFAPYGDDPLLISKVNIKNLQDTQVDLQWYEYWGGFNYQISFEGVMAAIKENDIGAGQELRRDKSKKLKNKFFLIDQGRCILNIKHESKLELPKERIEALELIANKRLKQKRPSLEDRYPPPIYLISLDEKADGWMTDGNSFFGSGGIEIPNGIKKQFQSELNSKGSESCLIMIRKFRLKPGESKTLYFAYGYLPEDFDLNKLISKYSTNFDSLLSKSCEKWNSNRIKLEIPEFPWIDRELTWHHYYLRGAMSYDSFFMEHILSQGHVYQYVIGFQGAARDPLQHVLPFLLCDPQIVKEIMRYTLKEVQEDGEIPYGITGNGMIMPSPWKPSDLELWLLWVASEYILSSRDKNFLNKEIPTYPIHGRKAGKSTVKELLQLCYTHFTEKTGKGKHGLQRLSNGDWNDMVVLGSYTDKQQSDIRKYAESVLNSAMAIKIFCYYAEMLQFIGDNMRATEILDYSNSLKKAVHNQWGGKWFKRAWLSEELGWIGEDRLWLEPQPWGIISDSTDDTQRKTLIESLNELVRNPSKIGAILHDKPLYVKNNPVGIGTNAGIWPSINGTLIWALSLVDRKLALEEWKKNTLAKHAEEYPDIWYGIWSGPDTYNSIYSKYPGQTIFDEYFKTGNLEDRSTEIEIGGINWTDWPVLNLHPHAWPLFNTKHLIGLEFTKEGLEIIPTLPFEEYSYSTPLFGLSKSKEGYSGWYAPEKEGTWKVTIKLAKNEIKKFSSVSINGIKKPLSITENKVSFTAKGTPLKWAIK